ncbi:hypothetical protein PC113_g3439 [Phytophthora cactorum]|uniref:Uncharacterized protein n=1 Tax=Phytophthora cactorum TaxID=29920 RepID=A0A8T0ZR68_9STRA|nr:hypothetical protein PC113_g3439 [Phytophthora cactorum]
MRGPPVRRIFRIPTPSAYSVRVLGADGVGIATLARAYTQLVGVSVLDAERPRPPAHASVDNRHFLVKPGQLKAARSRGFRSFSGPVKVFEVGQAATYCHTEVSSFEHFWASLVTVLAVPPDQADAGQATLVGGGAASPENGPSQASVPTTSRSGTTRRPPDVTVDGDFTIVRNRTKVRQPAV